MFNSLKYKWLITVTYDTDYRASETFSTKLADCKQTLENCKRVGRRFELEMFPRINLIHSKSYYNKYRGEIRLFDGAEELSLLDKG